MKEAADLSSVTIRPASKSDAGRIRDLWIALHREHEAMDDRYRLNDDAGERWQNDFLLWVDDNTRFLHVAEHDEEVIGFIHAHRYVEPPLYIYEPEIYIDDIFVEPSCRNRGVGSRLLDAVKKWGKGLGATRIRLRVLSQNQDGITFWEKEGGASLAQTYLIPLEAEERASEYDSPRKIGFL